MVCVTATYVLLQYSVLFSRRLEESSVKNLIVDLFFALVSSTYHIFYRFSVMAAIYRDPMNDLWHIPATEYAGNNIQRPENSELDYRAPPISMDRMARLLQGSSFDPTRVL